MAARLSGRAAGFNVGLLHIQTDGVAGLSTDNAFSVARIARELPNRSRVGVLLVDRSGEAAGDYNRTFAADGRWSIGEALTLSSFVAGTRTPGLTGDEFAWDATVGWNSRTWTGTLTAREIGEDFNPEVGFLPRSGYRYYQAYIQRFVRPDWIFREIRPHVSYFTYRSQRSEVEQGFEESARLHIDSHWEWPSGMELHTGTNWVLEGLYEPFSVIGTDVTVPAGTYDGWEAAVVFNTNRSADLSFDGRLNVGSFLSGDRVNASGTITLRSGAALSTSLVMEYNDVNLPQGNLETTLVGVNFGYFFTPRIYLQSLVQYSDQIDRLSANVRFGWLNTAGDRALHRLQRHPRDRSAPWAARSIPDHEVHAAAQRARGIGSQTRLASPDQAALGPVYTPLRCGYAPPHLRIGWPDAARPNIFEISCGAPLGALPFRDRQEGVFAC